MEDQHPGSTPPAEPETIDETFLAELAEKFERETQVYLGYRNVERAAKVRAIGARLAGLTAENERLTRERDDAIQLWNSINWGGPSTTRP